jgi:asparagine synthase (glutamine-hydrolysing)
MSVFFGKWNFDGKAVDPEDIGRARRILEPHAPDGLTTFVNGAFAMAHGALHRTEQSHRDQQPFTSPAGTFLMWDGRLDNRTELRFERPRQTDTDLEIAASLLEGSGTAGLGDMVGDWALALFNHFERTLVLAKDFLGARTLYYLHCDRFVAWSSLLEPLIASADKLTLCEEYLAGWLTGFPEANLTPYQEIRSVPPASFVRVTSHTAKVERYWEFRHEPIHLKSDAEYEERFRNLFFESVKRRLRSHAPVLAELSGGMDSSSIVCAADRLTATSGTHSIETISFFDDSEPNWNEKPFFTAVETLRGRSGFHLDAASGGRFLPERDSSFPATPAHGARVSESQEHYSKFLSNGGFGVLLSGIGGDEFTGGVPSGIPELADLLSTGQLRAFLRRGFLWSLASRKPLVQVLARTIRWFLPGVSASRSKTQWPTPWIKPAFRKHNRRALSSAASRLRWFGPLPSFQENLRVLDGLRRQIACAELPPPSSCEKRYPFLDRDLLEFLFNVPRDQLARPNQRRSLLRRAMRGIVPELVLDRPRKALVATSHLKAISSDWTRTSELLRKMTLESLGVIDSKILLRTLEEARRGGEVPLLPIMRALRLEWWMQDPAIRKLVGAPSSLDKSGALLLSLEPPIHEM